MAAPPPLGLLEFECAVCLNLLIDPVVGQCGHDLCKACLERWRQQQRSQGREQTRCPVCRQPFGSNLGVCVRLREMIQTLFGSQVAARRAELQHQAAADKKRSADRLRQEDLPLPATFSAAAPPSEAARRGRRRLHARRNQLLTAQRARSAAAAAGTTADVAVPGVPPAGGAASSSTGFAAGAGGQLLPHWLQQHLHSAVAHAAGGASQAADAGSGAGAAGASSSSTRWPILDVQFCMGWFEPRSSGSRGSRAARRARAGRRLRV